MSAHTIRFPATFDAYADASLELRRALEARGVADRPLYNAELVFEEIVSNIIRHGCRERRHCAIEVSLEFAHGAVVLTFEDDGEPFDLRSHRPAPRPRTLDEAGDGGLGLVLVRNAASAIEYERTGRDTNHVIVTIDA